MDELLTYKEILNASPEQAYTVLSNPEYLPRLFDHIIQVVPSGPSKTNYIENTQSLLGRPQKIAIKITRTPYSSVIMESNHRLLKMSMHIKIHPYKQHQCEVIWQIYSRHFPLIIIKLFKLFFSLWYKPKLRTALQRTIIIINS